MKRTLALLVSTMMLTGALSGCGTDKTGTGTGTTGGSGSGTTTSGTTAGSSQTTTTNPSTSGTGTSSTTGANTTGANTTRAKTAGTTSSAGATKQHAIIRGTSYGQMLRNARVHDADGILTDGENAVTPGATVY